MNKWDIIDENKAFAEKIAKDELQRLASPCEKMEWVEERGSLYKLRIRAGGRRGTVDLPYEWIIVIDRRHHLEERVLNRIRELFGPTTPD